MKNQTTFALTAIAAVLSVPSVGLADEAAPPAGQNRLWTLELGVPVYRPTDAPAQTYLPGFTSDFRTAGIDPTGQQAGDFSWAAGREIKLRLSPAQGWQLALGTRFGQVDRDDAFTVTGESFSVCRYGGTPPTCNGFPNFDTRSNYSQSVLHESEEHQLIDFTVGREVGIGRVLQGTLSAGLRYAQFESRSQVAISGVPDWNLPPNCWRGELTLGDGVDGEGTGALNDTCRSPITNENKYSKPATRTEYDATMQAKREFSGIGPVLAWEGASRLVGEEKAARLDLIWTVSGGILFGKQETSVDGGESSAYFRQTQLQNASAGSTNPDSTTSEAFVDQRDDSVTVTTVGLGLGLSYHVGGIGLSGGYRWERYMSVIDGGVAERQKADRTLEGPYFRLSVGFGTTGEE